MDDLILTHGLIQRTILFVYYSCGSGFMLLNSCKDTIKFQTIIETTLLTVTVKWTHTRRLEERCF
jgi:hypothetical protein